MFEAAEIPPTAGEYKACNRAKARGKLRPEKVKNSIDVQDFLLEERYRKEERIWYVIISSRRVRKERAQQ